MTAGRPQRPVGKARPRNGGTRRALVAAKAVAAVAIASVALIAVPSETWLNGDIGWRVIALAALAGTGAAALWVAQGLIDAHFDALERLRAHAVIARTSGSEALALPAVPSGPEIERLRDAIGALATARDIGGGTSEARLAAILGAVGEGLVVIDDAGRIALVNAPARRTLGLPVPALGHSVFAALRRDALAAAMAAARVDGGASTTLPTVDGSEIAARLVDLPDQGAVLLALPADDIGHGAAVEHDLALLDHMPPATPAMPSTPLSELPSLVLDVETTGLDPAHDRIVSLAGLPLRGARAYPGDAIDLLIDPTVPIPDRARAIHGIGDETVRGAPRFGVLAPDISRRLAGTVVVGHNIGFDLAVLAAEAHRAGIAWTAPLALDTARLASALAPRERDLDLETVAARLGVEIRGRHTALGDCLITAEVFARQIALLGEAGVVTLDDAQRFAATATAVVRRQRAAGW